MKQGEQIKMNSLASGPAGSFNVGDVLTIGKHVDLDTAKVWVESKHAESYQAAEPVQVEQPGTPDPDPVDDELTEQKLRKMRKAELLAVCASADFEISPPDGATNNALIDLILESLANQADQTPGD